MAYIGRDIQYGTLDKQSFTANGSTTAFTLDTAVKDAKSLLVVVGGVVQEPEVAYTASATTLSFSEAPPNGNAVYAIYLGKELSVGAARENITYQTGTGNGSTTPLTLSSAPYNAQAIMVTLNGVTQRPVTDYTVSGTTLTFTSAVATGVNILVYHLASMAEIGTINNNSVTNAKIVTMDASKLTGSLPDSMLFNTTKIDQSIATLGLHIGVSDNKVSYNLPTSFIDTFEDSSGILTETTVSRNTAGEYVASVSGGGLDSNHVLVLQSDTTNNSTTFTDISANGHTMTAVGNAKHSTTEKKIGASSIYVDGSGDQVHASSAHADFSFGTGDFTIEGWVMWTSSGTDKTFVVNRNAAGTTHWYTGWNTSYEMHMSTGSAVLLTSGVDFRAFVDTWKHVAFVRDNGTLRVYLDGVQKNSVSNTTNFSATNPIRFGDGDTQGASAMTGYLDGMRISKVCRYPNGTTFTPYTTNISNAVTNATGTLISTASTADAAVSKTSGIMLYEDASGTGTLGTDLKVYFSSNNGTNWTEAASYGAAQTFVGTTKMSKLGQTTITNTGTAVKMKAVWANQTAGPSLSGTKFNVTAGMLSGSNLSSFAASEIVDGSRTQPGSQGRGFYVSSGTTNGVMTLDLGNGNAQALGKISAWCAIATSAAVWAIQYSDNNSSWTNTTLTNFAPGASAFSQNGGQGDFIGTWDNVGAHRYWRMTMVSGNGGSQGWVGDEIEWYAFASSAPAKVQRLHGWAVNY